MSVNFLVLFLFILSQNVIYALLRLIFFLSACVCSCVNAHACIYVRMRVYVCVCVCALRLFIIGFLYSLIMPFLSFLHHSALSVKRWCNNVISGFWDDMHLASGIFWSFLKVLKIYRCVPIFFFYFVFSYSLNI